MFRGEADAARGTFAGAAILILLMAPAVAAQEAAPAVPARPAAQPGAAGLQTLLTRIEQVLTQGDPAGYLALTTAAADPEHARVFSAAEVFPGATAVTVKERDRQALPELPEGTGYLVILDAFVERGYRARVSTWQIDARWNAASGWRIADQVRLSAVDNLYQLAVDGARQFAVRNFVVRAEDLEIELQTGTVFMVRADDQVTGLVLSGRGEMRFRPAPEVEQAQVRIFAGSETLRATFDAAYVRTADLDTNVNRSELREVPVNVRDLRRAEAIFREESVKTYVMDLGDLSPRTWSLLPASGDFLSEVRTRQHGTLTYVRSGAEAEDIFVINRERELNISVYASRRRLEERGRFYDENARDAYEVTDYDVDITYLPDRQWIEGRTRLRIRARERLSGQLNLKLSDAFTVHGVASDRFGRLFTLRARGMNTVVLHLPEPLEPSATMALTVFYGGRLEPQVADREGLQFIPPAPILTALEPSYLYSSRSFWYAQSPVANYATATIRISVPDNMGCIATGEPMDGFPRIVGGQDGVPSRRLYAFRAERPVRYLSFLVSRLMPVDQAVVVLDDPSDAAGRLPELARALPSPGAGGPTVEGEPYRTLNVSVLANPRQLQRGRQMVEDTADMARLYYALLGDSPYSSFTVGLVENDRPGGHSPAYFAVLNQPHIDAPIVWRNDPVEFGGYPEFFLAHELAHQWWGQGVGWNSYHEQWLSEGISQYFALLYAEHRHGSQLVTRMLRQMRTWAMRHSDQGPVYLGYRLGHVREESRIFRALVYNKGGAVMHMLRRLMGDEAFFRGLRRFYVDARYRKVGTETLRAAMEEEAGRSLEQFFERWIYRAALPDLTLAHRVEETGDGQDLVLRVTQGGDLFDVPVAVRVTYTDGRSLDVIVPVTERSVDHRVRLDGRFRSLAINNDDGTLADVRRASF